MTGMTSKGIREHLRRKFTNFLESIEDETICNLVENNTIITGGCIASMLLGERVHDYDIYFRSRDVARRVAEYYVDRFNPQGNKPKISVNEYTDWRGQERIRIVVKSAGIASEEGSSQSYQYFEGRPDEEGTAYVGDIMLTDPGEIEDAVEDITSQIKRDNDKGDNNNERRYRPVFLSTNAITLSDQIQLILRFNGEPDQIHKNYDFTHCTNYWSSWDNTLVLRPEALQSLLAKELIYTGSLYPVCSLFRLRKFIRRGWRINAGQILKMALQISELDLHRIEVLQDQLTGVDVAYFTNLMSRISSDRPEKINAAYVIEIIDRMF
jgi:hypothetical protein